MEIRLLWARREWLLSLTYSLFIYPHLGDAALMYGRKDVNMGLASPNMSVFRLEETSVREREVTDKCEEHCTVGLAEAEAQPSGRTPAHQTKKPNEYEQY